jgi:hypothetical protein
VSNRHRHIRFRVPVPLRSWYYWDLMLSCAGLWAPVAVLSCVETLQEQRHELACLSNHCQRLIKTGQTWQNSGLGHTVPDKVLELLNGRHGWRNCRLGATVAFERKSREALSELW